MGDVPYTGGIEIMTTRPRRLAMVAVLMIASASAPFGLTIDLTDPEIRQALAIGRDDRGRQRFDASYLHTTDHPTVRLVEVITEFRRMAFITAERHAAGDWLFVHGMREAKEALKPWRGVVTVVAHLQFSTFGSVPPLNLILTDSSPYGAAVTRAIRTVPQWSPSIAGDGSMVLTGASVETDFGAASIGQTSRTAVIFLAGKELARVPLDFAAVR